MKPVELDNTALQLLPPQFQGAACSKCLKLQSKWSLERPDEEPATVCSLCLMYVFPWGVKRQAQLREFVLEVEKARGVTFAKTEEDALVEIQDADRIIGAIVLTSRVFQARRRLEFYED